MKRQEVIGRYLLREDDQGGVMVSFSYCGMKVATDTLCTVHGQPGVDLWKRGEWIARTMNVSDYAQSDPELTARIGTHEAKVLRPAPLGPCQCTTCPDAPHTFECGDAVRTVVVVRSAWSSRDTRDVPMCEPCARHAEEKANQR